MSELSPPEWKSCQRRKLKSALQSGGLVRSDPEWRRGPCSAFERERDAPRRLEPFVLPRTEAQRSGPDLVRERVQRVLHDRLGTEEG